MFFHECSSVARQPARRQPCGARPCLSRALGLSVGARCLPRPLHKGTAKAFLTGKATGLRHACEGQIAAVQQMQGAVAAHIVLELLQTAALLLQLPVQAARRNVQQLRQTGRRVRALRVGRQRLAHTLHQRLGRPVSRSASQS